MPKGFPHSTIYINKQLVFLLQSTSILCLNVLKTTNPMSFCIFVIKSIKTKIQKDIIFKVYILPSSLHTEISPPKVKKTKIQTDMLYKKFNIPVRNVPQQVNQHYYLIYSFIHHFWILLILISI